MGLVPSSELRCGASRLDVSISVVLLRVTDFYELVLRSSTFLYTAISRKYLAYRASQCGQISGVQTVPTKGWQIPAEIVY